MKTFFRTTTLLLVLTGACFGEEPRWTNRDLLQFVTVPPAALPDGVQLSRSPVHLPSPSNPIVTSNRKVVAIGELTFDQAVGKVGRTAKAMASAVYRETSVKDEAGILVLVYANEAEAKRVYEGLRRRNEVVHRGPLLVHVWRAGASQQTAAALGKHVKETSFPPRSSAN